MAITVFATSCTATSCCSTWDTCIPGTNCGCTISGVNCDCIPPPE